TATLETAETEDDATGDETAATAEDTVTWDLSQGDDSESAEDAEWSYTTDATLVWNTDAEAWEPQLDSDTLVPGLAEHGRVNVETTAAKRGEIVDGEDEPITKDRQVQKIGIEKGQLLDER